MPSPAQSFEADEVGQHNRPPEIEGVDTSLDVYASGSPPRDGGGSRARPETFPPRDRGGGRVARDRCIRFPPIQGGRRRPPRNRFRPPRRRGRASLAVDASGRRREEVPSDLGSDAFRTREQTFDQPQFFQIVSRRNAFPLLYWTGEVDLRCKYCKDKH